MNTIYKASLFTYCVIFKVQPIKLCSANWGRQFAFHCSVSSLGETRLLLFLPETRKQPEAAVQSKLQLKVAKLSKTSKIKLNLQLV